MNSKELIKAKQVFEKGKFEEVLLLLKKIEKKEELTDIDKLTLNLLKSSVFYRFREDEKCFKYAEKAYQESQKLGNYLYSIDALLNMAWSLLWLGDFEKTFELTLKSENILKTLTNIREIDRERREASILFTKASGYWFQANLDGLDFAKRSLKLRQKIGIKHEIVESYSIVCGFLTHFHDDLDYALKVLEQCQALAIEINHPWMNSFNPKNFGDIYYMKGDLEKALTYYKKAIIPFEERNNPFPIITTISELGKVYREMGDLDQCLIHLKNIYQIAIEKRNNWVKSEVIANLIEVLIVKGAIKEAQNYLKELKEISKQETNNKSIEQSYLISKALVLKSNPRFHNQAKAQLILKQIIDKEAIKNENFIFALLNQCEILLEELRITYNIEIINEIQSLINKLLESTKKLRSYWILAETYVLQAELALLTFELKQARQLLTNAQKIAEKYGMHRLAAKISIDHDKLLQKLSIWESLRDSKSPLSERFKLTNLNKHMTYMIQKRRSEFPVVLEEDSIMILIITQGGNVIFSHSFIKDKAFESHIFGGFITTIDYFVKEMFSEGLDRAMFGEYTLLMKSVPPFFITYIFKGDSYYAHQKIKYFINSIQYKELIWQNLVKCNQINKNIHIKEIPLLESLITDIFVKKNIVLKAF